MKFNWSNRNLVEGKWVVFYYCKGAEMNTGLKVYYGKNLWNSEEDAISDQKQWEARIGN